MLVITVIVLACMAAVVANLPFLKRSAPCSPRPKWHELGLPADTAVRG